jgi:hypothetical protein
VTAYTPPRAISYGAGSVFHREVLSWPSAARCPAEESGLWRNRGFEGAGGLVALLPDALARADHGLLPTFFARAQGVANFLMDRGQFTHFVFMPGKTSSPSRTTGKKESRLAGRFSTVRETRLRYTRSTMTTSPLHGVVVGRLTESHATWIVVGEHTLFLRLGEACHYKLGTTLQVCYIEQDGRSDVQSIM